jgi:hypothetical protein
MFIEFENVILSILLTSHCIKMLSLQNTFTTGSSVRSMQVRMAKGFHGVPRVSLGPAMTDSSMPCGWSTPKTALWQFLGWSAHRTDSLRLSYTPLDTPRRTSLVLWRAVLVLWVVEKSWGVVGHRPLCPSSLSGPYGKGYPRGKKTAAGRPPCAGRIRVGHGGAG